VLASAADARHLDGRIAQFDARRALATRTTAYAFRLNISTGSRWLAKPTNQNDKSSVA
jgi:hypothetical protein